MCGPPAWLPRPTSTVPQVPPAAQTRSGGEARLRHPAPLPQPTATPPSRTGRSHATYT